MPKAKDKTKPVKQELHPALKEISEKLKAGTPLFPGGKKLDPRVRS